MRGRSLVANTEIGGYFLTHAFTREPFTLLYVQIILNC